MKQPKIYIYVTTSFIGFHSYKQAPEEVTFLQHKHRHKFNVIVKIRVNSLNRELEFFMVLDELNLFLKNTCTEIDQSCEGYASLIHSYITNKYSTNEVSVIVNEDGENGAEVTTIC